MDSDPRTDAQTGTSFAVVDRPDRQRFELQLGGEVVGFASSSIRDDVVTITHVETELRHRGNGFAGRLMDGIVDDLRRSGRTIRPLCPYAAAYLRDRPDTHDLIES